MCLQVKGKLTWMFTPPQVLSILGCVDGTHVWMRVPVNLRVVRRRVVISYITLHLIPLRQGLSLVDKI